MVSTKMTGICEITAPGVLIDNRKKYSKTKIKEKTTVKTSDLPPILKKLRARYIVTKTESMATVKKPKVKPEKKSKNAAAGIMKNKSAGALSGHNRANKITKTGKMKIGHGVTADSTRSKTKIITDDIIKSLGLDIKITVPAISSLTCSSAFLAGSFEVPQSP
jgi:hypothetical protein